MPSAENASEMLIVPVHHHGKELPPTLMMTCDVASCFARPSRSLTKPDEYPLPLLLNTTTSCIHHQSIESSIALLHLQVLFHRVPSTANTNHLKSIKNNQTPHRRPHIPSTQPSQIHHAFLHSPLLALRSNCHRVPHQACLLYYTRGS